VLLVLWLSRHPGTWGKGGFCTVGSILWVLYCGFFGRHGTGPSALRKRGRPLLPERKGFGRAPLRSWRRQSLPSGTVLCDALFMCVGSITIDSPISGRVPVPRTDLRIGCTLCASLVCDICMEINNPSRISGRPLPDGWAATLCL
jgi:hypothetical protein